MFILGSLESSFQSALIDVFLLGATAEALERIHTENWRFRSDGVSLALNFFQVEGVVPTNHSSSHKSSLNGLSYGIKIWTELSFVLSQSTRLTDRRTDRRTNRQLSCS